MKELVEQRGILDAELKALTAKFEAKTLNETEEKRFDEVISEIESLNAKIVAAEKREQAIKDAEQRSLPKGPGLLINPSKTDNETQAKTEFRFTTVINNLVDQKPLEGFYKEMHEEGQRDMAQSGIKNTNQNGYIIPSFITGNSEKRDLSSITSTPGAGNYIATDLLTGEYIDNLKNALVMTKLGAHFMTGLKGNIDIPRKTTDSGANWLTETGSITAADFVTDKVSMSPKRLGNATAFSRQLLLQSSMDIEMLVRRDLIMSQALALEAAAIKGPSTGNGPLGILNTSGIGSVVIGNNGGALTWAAIVALETAVANSNADINKLGYLTNSRVRGAAKGIVRDSGSGLFLWGTGYGQSGGDTLPMNGYKAEVTNAVPNTNVKGNSGAVCSSLIFGNWDDLYIGQWGGLILTANPYSLDLSGQVRVVCNSYYDIDVRHAESFAAINDITT
jgi:HK97 family phage major capsid protein